MPTLREAIEVQDELRQFWRSKLGHDFAEGWIESRKQTGTGHLNDTPRVMMRNHGSIAERASLYWVKGEMVELCDYAAARMPDQVLRTEDVPSEFGLAVFEHPVFMPDARGKLVNVAAILWGKAGIGERGKDAPMQNGLVVALYSDLNAKDGYEVPHFRGLPRLGLFHEEPMVFGEAVAPADMAMKLHGPRILPPEVDAENWKHHRKFPLALWTIIQQPLAVVSHQKPDRHARRRLARAGSPLAVSTIRVVTLRRLVVKQKPGESEPVAWSHQWIVSGHWRNVWHSSTREHRLQWIHPFIKGPADMPLVVKKTVHKLVR